ncbi:MAG: hypothetical protein JW863_15910 [Chitinispirillaceae bacterium]|nr:hypothetical protein [Chitinispirillaceae bacterium]
MILLNANGAGYRFPPSFPPRQRLPGILVDRIPDHPPKQGTRIASNAPPKRQLLPIFVFSLKIIYFIAK